MIGSSCAQGRKQEESLNFDLAKYESPEILESKRDSSIAFINLLKKGDYRGAKQIYPKTFDLDVSIGIQEIEGEKPSLIGLGNYVNDYSKNTYDLLALTVFLRERHNANVELYDKMLRGALRLDSTNVPAMYLLSDLRYEHGKAPDAYYLIQRMHEEAAGNQEIDRLYSLTEPYIKRLVPGITFQHFLFTDISYSYPN